VYDIERNIPADLEMVIDFPWTLDGIRAGLRVNGLITAAFAFSSQTTLGVALPGWHLWGGVMPSWIRQ